MFDPQSVPSTACVNSVSTCEYTSLEVMQLLKMMMITGLGDTCIMNYKKTVSRLSRCP